MNYQTSNKTTFTISLSNETLAFLDCDRVGMTRDEYINGLIQKQIKQHIANAIKSAEKVNHNYR